MSRLDLGLLIGRLFTGYWFLSAALIKIVQRNFLFSDALLSSLNLFLASPGPTWYKVFLADVVIPNLRLFACLGAAAEPAAGLGGDPADRRGRRGPPGRPGLLPQKPEALRQLLTEYRVGICSWTDPSLIKEGEFYPARSMSAEERLRYYATAFDTVEVDSSYYALPSARNAALWVERTPPGFLFNVKAYSLMTGHHPRAGR